jgi:hypothetical protein
MRRILPTYIVLLCAGCYSYTAMSTPSPDAGAEVRVDLTDAGSVRLASTIGQRVESIDGRCIAVSDTSLLLAVTATISRGGDIAHWNNERVDIPKSATSRIQGKRLDAKRSYLASALTVAGVFVVGRVFGIGSGGGLLGGSGSGSGKQ